MWELTKQNLWEPFSWSPIVQDLPSLSDHKHIAVVFINSLLLSTITIVFQRKTCSSSKKSLLFFTLLSSYYLPGSANCRSWWNCQRERDKESSVYNDIMKIYIPVSELSWPQINNVNQRGNKQNKTKHRRDKKVGLNSFCSIKIMVKRQFQKKAANSFKQRRC